MKAKKTTGFQEGQQNFGDCIFLFMWAGMVQHPYKASLSLQSSWSLLHVEHARCPTMKQRCSLRWVTGATVAWRALRLSKFFRFCFWTHVIFAKAEENLWGITYQISFLFYGRHIEGWTLQTELKGFTMYHISSTSSSLRLESTV